MWIPLVGLIIGLVIGAVFPGNIHIFDAKYLSISALSSIDSVFIGFRAKLNNHFNTTLFTIEFVLNTIIAIGLVYLGDIMNTDLFIAVAIIFSARVFYNLSNLNHQLFFQK
ncbi:MAG: small basic family protein [Candidatus Gastranaerophilales bacterium]|nr:small basic family protein [Candidatus Gastranaerophilales bacterium]